MWKLDKPKLKKKYPALAEIINGYTDPEDSFVINDDKDLAPITIEIAPIIERTRMLYSYKNPPKGIVAPNPTKIEGWGLPAQDQYFTLPKKPQQLTSLEKQFDRPSKRKASVTVLDSEEFHDELESNPVKYAESIKYIKKMLYYLRYGYWCFINGKPTYVTGWHFRKLALYKQGSFEVIDRKTGRVVSSELPEYRDIDRRRFLFYQWCYTDTTDHKGIDYGRRTCFGWVMPKWRRVGATTDAIAIICDIATTIRDSYSSMIGNVNDTGMDTFQKKFVTAYVRQPVWLRPRREGRMRPQKEMRFIVQGGGTRQHDKPLESWVDYANKADRGYYDHAEITGCILMDEEGKTTATDIFEGWNVVKPTMAPGGGTAIRKFAVAAHPSTVEEMAAGGGEAYFRLCQTSDYFKSSELTGQTESGLRIFFKPAYDGLEGFIGPYGESIIDTPTDQQSRHIGKRFGAKKFLEDTAENMEKQDTIVSKIALASFRRKYPTKWEHVWDIRGQDTGFNREKLSKRYTQIKIEGEHNHVRIGNLYWEIDNQMYSARQYIHTFGTSINIDIDKRSKVVFVDEENGRFHMSHLTGRIELSSNKKQIVPSDVLKYTQMFSPVRPGVFTGSADPMQSFSETEFRKSNQGIKMSMGGGHVLMNHDLTVDPYVKPLVDWETYTTVCDYLFRPDSSEEYAEEMLMMAIFWGCMMYPERNKTVVVDHFTNRGYHGFLKYDIDKNTNAPVKEPGFYTTAGNSDTKDDLFRGMRSYIENHIMRDHHIRVIRQCLDLKGFEDMTNQDLFTAAAGSIRGERSLYSELAMERMQNIDISDYLAK